MTKEQEQDKDEATDEQQEHALRSTCVQVADVDGIYRLLFIFTKF